MPHEFFSFIKHLKTKTKSITRLCESGTQVSGEKGQSFDTEGTSNTLWCYSMHPELTSMPFASWKIALFTCTAMKLSTAKQCTVPFTEKKPFRKQKNIPILLRALKIRFYFIFQSDSFWTYHSTTMTSRKNNVYKMRKGTEWEKDSFFQSIDNNTKYCNELWAKLNVNTSWQNNSEYRNEPTDSNCFCHYKWHHTYFDKTENGRFKPRANEYWHWQIMFSCMSLNATAPLPPLSRAPLLKATAVTQDCLLRNNDRRYGDLMRWTWPQTCPADDFPGGCCIPCNPAESFLLKEVEIGCHGNA